MSRPTVITTDYDAIPKRHWELPVQIVPNLPEVARYADCLRCSRPLRDHTWYVALVDKYADRIRTDAIHGRERSYAAGFIDAMTDIEARHSNARRQQRAAAILAAADQVRTDRRLDCCTLDSH